MKTIRSTEQALKVKGYRYQKFTTDCMFQANDDPLNWMKLITETARRHDELVQQQLAKGVIYLSHPQHKVVKKPVIVNIEQRHGFLQYSSPLYHAFYFHTFIFIK